MNRDALQRTLLATLLAAGLAGAAALWWRWGEAVVLSQPTWFCAPI